MKSLTDGLVVISVLLFIIAILHTLFSIGLTSGFFSGYFEVVENPTFGLGALEELIDFLFSMAWSFFWFMGSIITALFALISKK